MQKKPRAHCRDAIRGLLVRDCASQATTRRQMSGCIRPDAGARLSAIASSSISSKKIKHAFTRRPFSAQRAGPPPQAATRYYRAGAIFASSRISSFSSLFLLPLITAIGVSHTSPPCITPHAHHACSISGSFLSPPLSASRGSARARRRMPPASGNTHERIRRRAGMAAFARCAQKLILLPDDCRRGC